MVHAVSIVPAFSPDPTLIIGKRNERAKSNGVNFAQTTFVTVISIQYTNCVRGREAPFEGTRTRAYYKAYVSTKPI